AARRPALHRVVLITLIRPPHSLSSPRPRTKIGPGAAIWISSDAGTADGLGLAGAAVSCFTARLLISTTCSRVTLGGRLSGIVKSPWSVVSRAVTFGDEMAPAIATVPLDVRTASSRPTTR